MKERLQKVLANAGVASRRNVEEMILQGRVSVNGRAVSTLPVLIDPDEDEVEVDGEAVRLRGREAGPRLYFLLNKPRGVYSTNVAQGAQVRAIDLLPSDLRARLYPVGRLDAESRGLLLLTNDGDLTHRLTHPRFGVPKTYRVLIDGQVPPEALRELEEGVWLADPKGKAFKTSQSRVRVVKRLRDRSLLEVTLREGRNREVRRMLARMGHKVRDLIRVTMGPLTLEGLAPGRFRALTPRELRALRDLAHGESPAAAEGASAGAKPRRPAARGPVRERRAKLPTGDRKPRSRGR